MQKKDSSHIFSIGQFREGSQVDYKYLFDKHYDGVYLFVYNMIRTETEAQDITTDTFIKLWKIRANFDSVTSINAFLYITARNASIDFIRRRQRQREVQEGLRYMVEGEQESIDNAQIDAEVLQLIAREIDRLPARCREVFKFMYYDRLGTAQVAGLMGISTKNVQAQKTRAIGLLRMRLLGNHLLEL